MAAERLRLKVFNVRTHVGKICLKAGMDTQSQLVTLLQQAH